MGGSNCRSDERDRDENQFLEWHLESSELQAVQQGYDESRGAHQQTRDQNSERTPEKNPSRCSIIIFAHKTIQISSSSFSD